MRNQLRGHRTGSSNSGTEEYPREKARTNQRWYTHNISQLTQFMPPPETYKSEIGSQSTMCQVHTGTYVSLLAPGKTDYTACHPRKTTTCILHVVPITTHTHDRPKSIRKKIYKGLVSTYLKRSLSPGNVTQHKPVFKRTIDGVPRLFSSRLSACLSAATSQVGTIQHSDLHESRHES